MMRDLRPPAKFVSARGRGGRFITSGSAGSVPSASAGKPSETRLIQRIMRGARNDHLSEMATGLRSIPGIGPVASTMLVAEMPEIGTITGEKAAAHTGFAPVAHDSGTLRGKRAIAGGCRTLRHAMFQAALVAAHHNPSLRYFADCLRKAAKPHMVIITAVARKLVTIANALRKSRQEWAALAT